MIEGAVEGGVEGAIEGGASLLGECQIHVHYHGCTDSHPAYYANHLGIHEWAATNGLIVLHPRAADGRRNEGGCWDWDGATGDDFDTHNGPQLRTVLNMVEAFGRWSGGQLRRWGPTAASGEPTAASGGPTAASGGPTAASVGPIAASQLQDLLLKDVQLEEAQWEEMEEMQTGGNESGWRDAPPHEST